MCCLCVTCSIPLPNGPLLIDCSAGVQNLHVSERPWVLSALTAGPASSSSSRPCLLLSAKLLICQGESSQPCMRPNFTSAFDCCWLVRPYSMTPCACTHKAESYCMIPGNFLPIYNLFQKVVLCQLIVALFQSKCLHAYCTWLLHVVWQKTQAKRH